MKSTGAGICVNVFSIRNGHQVLVFAPLTTDDNTSNEYGASTTDTPNGTPATTSTTTEASSPTLEHSQEQKQVPATTDGPKPCSTSPLSTMMTTAATTASAGIESKHSIFQRLNGPALNEQHLQDRNLIPDPPMTVTSNNQQQQRGSKIIPNSSAAIATTAASDQQQKDSKPIPGLPSSAAASVIAPLTKKPTSAFPTGNLAISPPASQSSRSASPPKQPRSQTIAAEPPKQTTTIAVPNSSAPPKQQPVALDKVKILTLEEIRAAKRAKQEAEEAAKKEEDMAEAGTMGATQKSQAQTSKAQTQASQAQTQEQASQAQAQTHASKAQTQVQTSQVQTQAQAPIRKINRSRQPPAIAGVSPAATPATTPAAISAPTITVPQRSAAVLKRGILPTPGTETSGNAPTTSQSKVTSVQATNDTKKRPAKQEVLVAAAASVKGSATNGINSGTAVPATALTGKGPAPTTGKVPAVAPMTKRNLESSTAGPTQNGANKKAKINASAIAITNTKSNITASTPSIRPPETTKAVTPNAPTPNPTVGVSALALGTLSTIESVLEDDEMLLDAPEFYDKELSAKDIEELEKELGLS
ncbi:hypothetical protein BC937DRAFT_92485 [Endogone sp. FLAS-F59071]|nr:hypothetical protein BC937DRAFT_92485 [Endogone sp. FLAS-F59071]|eukprot:RUS21491.1 hypothetical protein BC937DRAFT_92485 [Endogone sp. FLAS-F59071]